MRLSSAPPGAATTPTARGQCGRAQSHGRDRCDPTDCDSGPWSAEEKRCPAHSMRSRAAIRGVRTAFAARASWQRARKPQRSRASFRVLRCPRTFPYQPEIRSSSLPVIRAAGSPSISSSMREPSESSTYCYTHQPLDRYHLIVTTRENPHESLRALTYHHPLTTTNGRRLKRATGRCALGLVRLSSRLRRLRTA